MPQHEAGRSNVFPPIGQASSPEAGLTRPSPTLRRDAMGGDMMRRQALTDPNAIEGDGGYVYSADPTGAINILHDPTGAATGATLTDGEAFEAIKAEILTKTAATAQPAGSELPPGDPGRITAEPADPEFINPALTPEEQERVTAQHRANPPEEFINPALTDTVKDNVRRQQNPPFAPEKPHTMDTSSGFGGGFNPNTARSTGPADTAPPDTADTGAAGGDPKSQAQAAISLPEGDPRRAKAMEDALRALLGS